MNSDKKFVLLHMKNKPVPNDFDRIKTNHMTIRNVRIVNYLGPAIHENVYFACNDPPINYGIEVYGHRADEHLSKL